MAQAMITLKKLNNCNNIGTQTSLSSDFIINLSQNKHFRVYYSEAYQENVLSFNINKSKSFIMTASMWNIFKKHFKKIDNILNFE